MRLGILVIVVLPPVLTGTGLHAQGLRVAAWGSFEGVTGSQDWSLAAAQLTVRTAQGHSAWAAVERTGRFGEVDITARAGALWHPNDRWWLTVEGGSAAQPTFMPKNTWEADATVRIASRASLGLGYRRWNYQIGPVDALMPHLAIETRRMAWDLRVFFSRNPSDRTDAAFYLRATRSAGRRAAVWVLAGAGRESFLVGAAPTQQIRSLETVTAAAGLRYNAGGGLTIRIDAGVTRSRPVLSRRGVGVGVEWDWRGL